ncbi:MAG: class I SAM-dependent methyltransferase [Balneolaceae bacterium]|nr:MAG: class I SAM-dependent methyltransferase [Balneolaceae bacterium]
MNFLTTPHIRIKHADWPYILQSFLVYFLLLTVSYFLLNQFLFFISLAVLSIFFIIITQFHLYRVQQNESEYLQYKIQCLNELYKLLPMRSPLPPMTGWAATPELAITVQKVVQKYKPDLIVETGSGVTTLIAAYSLEKHHPGGKIISLDHDPVYANKTRDEIKLHSLSDWAEVRTAPLEKMKIAKNDWIWYSTEAIHFHQPIDLLVIDGPPVKTQKNARYPALPVLYPYLAKKAVIIMHDTDRSSESSILKKWLDEYDDLTIQTLYGEKGITILVRSERSDTRETKYGLK